MSSVQLRTEEYRLTHHQQNIFSLKPTSPRSNLQIHLHYHFPSLYFPKTQKIINTVPAVAEQKSISTLFSTKLDVQLNFKSPSFKGQRSFYSTCKSMKNLKNKEKDMVTFFQSKYIPKPVSTYCQICKENFQNYLQHINHSTHQKKLKQSSITNEDFLQMNNVLQKKTFQLQMIGKNSQMKRQNKRNVTFNQSDVFFLRKSQSSFQSFQITQKIISEHKSQNKQNQRVQQKPLNEQDVQESEQIFGSKKRMQLFSYQRIEKDSGQSACVRIGSLRKICHNQMMDIQQTKKYVSFRHIEWGDENTLRDSELDSQFQLGLNLN